MLFFNKKKQNYNHYGKQSIKLYTVLSLRHTKRFSWRFLIDSKNSSCVSALTTKNFLTDLNLYGRRSQSLILLTIGLSNFGSKSPTIYTYVHTAQKQKQYCWLQPFLLTRTQVFLYSFYHEYYHVITVNYHDGQYFIASSRDLICCGSLARLHATKGV